MREAIKLWIAKRLAPEVFQKADAHFWTWRDIGELGHWCCSEFPEVDLTVRWLIHKQSARYRDVRDPLPELAIPIFNFRERLRRLKAEGRQ